MNKIIYLRFDKIIEPEFDVRLSTDQNSDDDLRDSIRELGILEPILVKDTEKGYEIIAGHRRFQQGIRAGLASAPCLVVKTSGANSEKFKLHENMKRLPLSHIDQAYTFAHLQKLYKMTEQQIATLCGRSIGYVSQHLSLLQCDEILIQAVQDNRINFSIARELMRCDDKDEALRLQQQIELHGASTGIVKSWVDESNRETRSIDAPPAGIPSQFQPATPAVAMYPCGVCSDPINIPEIQILRMCPGCYNLFFSELEREKQRLRIEAHNKKPPAGQERPI